MIPLDQVVASPFGRVVIHTAALRPNNRDMPAGILETSPTVAGMCAAGLALLVIGMLAAKHDIADARGLDKIVALGNVSFAIPLAVFGALHLFGPRFVTQPGAAVHAVACVLGLCRRRRARRCVREHRCQDRRALVRPAVRDHDVSLRRHDPSSRRARAPALRESHLDDRLPRDVVWRRGLDSRGDGDGRMAPARQEHTGRRRTGVRRGGHDRVWRRALSAPHAAPRRSTGEADGGLDSGARAHRLRDRARLCSPPRAASCCRSTRGP